MKGAEFRVRGGLRSSGSLVSLFGLTGGENVNFKWQVPTSYGEWLKVDFWFIGDFGDCLWWLESQTFGFG